MRQQNNKGVTNKEYTDALIQKQAATDRMLQQLMDPGFGVSLNPAQIEGGQMPKPPAMLVETQGSDDDDVDTKHVDAEEFKDSKGKAVWLEHPTYENQYTKYPTTCRMVGPQMCVFNMTDPAQLADLNRMLLLQIPEEAPRIMVRSKKENFHEGKWLMLLEYFRVEYKKLITD